MKYVFLDFETYYSKEYSLKKMTPLEYVLDPRFELIGCTVAEGVEDSFWVDGPDFGNFLKMLNPWDTCLVSHNALFDMCIVAWKYGWLPRLMTDTLGMARATLLHRIKSGSVSLSSVAMTLGIGVKGDALQKVEGMGYREIVANGHFEELRNYGRNDLELCRDIYIKLHRQLPASEYLVMDSIFRCCINPKFMLDANVLAAHAHQIKVDKDTLLAQVEAYGTSKADFMSNEKFATALRTFGVDPPTKTSKLTGDETYAFAKTDQEMIELETHEDPRVQALVAARLGFKSTIEETRTARLQSIANLTIPGKPQGMMPMPIRYAGAHTHRLSGDWQINMQNLPRNSKIRDALVAPSGHKVISCDASQIEARITAWLCGQSNLIDQFRQGADTYSNFASKIYGRPITRRDNPTERFVGKQAILGLGFGMGASRFEHQVKSDSHKQGLQVEVDFKFAQDVVDKFRQEFPSIPAAWAVLSDALTDMMKPECNISFGPVLLRYQHILLPNGLKIHYHKLRVDGEKGKGGIVYDYGREVRKLFGGKVLENIVQALARTHTLSDALLALRTRLFEYDIELAHTVHDELVYVVPEEYVHIVAPIVQEEMSRSPSWAPDIPLNAEVKVGKNYGELEVINVR
jgi:DNA polymerase I-like protein with 3'-5' exonuclease and polymerase domains